MTGWEPATEAEVAMRDALRAQDQQLYFRVLTRVDLLLPVAAEKPAGRGPTGWGTWTTGGRTHVLAFTSATALRACLGENAGATRRVPYADLAADWPNHEWWLAVNPGLPIEGYLPAWFVAQLARGDVRLPGRTMGARARLERVESAARAARGGPPAPGRDVPPPPVSPPPVSPPPVSPAAGGRVPPARSEPAGEPSTVPIPTVPAPSTRPTVPGAADPPAPPPSRRPDPANGRPARPLGRRTWDDARPTGPAGSEPGADNLDGWLTDLRRRPDEPDPFTDAGRSGPTNGRSVEPAPPPARSFFEPTSGRSPRRPSPLDAPRRGGDRATPPSRFAGGGQPFPRRRPLNEPVPEDPTQAFRVNPAEPTPASRPAEPERPFRPAPAAEATQALPRRHPGTGDDPGSEDQTQPIPGPADLAEAEELPPSIAEPVSAPPASRRGFTPIVIEGTVIESRELTEPAPRPAAVPPPAPYAVPTVPAAASAMASATAPAASPGDGGPAAPWAGPTDPTVPLLVDPPPSPVLDRAAGPSDLRAAPAAGTPADMPAERTVPLSGPSAPLSGPSAPHASNPADDPRPSPLFTAAGSGDEPTAPLAGPPAGPVVSPPDRGATADEATTSLFAPTSPAPEPTTSRFASASPAPEPTASLFASTEPTAPQRDRSAPAEERTTLFAPAPSEDERTEPLFEPPAPPPDVPLFEPPAGTDTRPFTPAAEEPTTSVFAPNVAADEATTSVFVPTAAAAEGPATSMFAPAAPAAEPTTSVFAPAAGPVPPEKPTAGAAGSPVDGARDADFVPANEVEEELLSAAGSGSTDSFLTTLLLARVLLPVAADSVAGSRPGDPGFVWCTEQIDGGTYVVVYTSPERLAHRAGGPTETVRVKFVQLIRRWPDVSWSFAVNPGTPVGATYPGEQVLALANWAAEVGLGDDPETEPEPPTTAPAPSAEPRPAAPAVDPARPVTMQKAIAPSQLAYYLERGYDRVSGFVHRAGELAHLGTPAELYDALGLGHPGSPFSRDAEEIYVLRWPAYRPSLYRIPYGGQNEGAMRAMEGWVIERPPFRGNGFAPGESSDVVAEFKVDSARLPHGAELWRIGADRSERVVAVLDTDALLWVRADEA
ncbi:SseB family protein [Micromonospora chersina]|uniref:SseB protein N-terminal domain-containing protein n=1 Tax=Micromonospora chersina TaxID=47854 RepID=A0A1C6VC90_9ACTN|nr:SseB family protein [Micromonospora chersina]SCL63460.1 SseB protein N-terminal domain-containing protein [Micromonospora chersina]